MITGFKVVLQSALTEYLISKAALLQANTKIVFIYQQEIEDDLGIRISDPDVMDAAVSQFNNRNTSSFEADRHCFDNSHNPLNKHYWLLKHKPSSTSDESALHELQEIRS